MRYRSTSVADDHSDSRIGLKTLRSPGPVDPPISRSSLSIAHSSVLQGWRTPSGAAMRHGVNSDAQSGTDREPNADAGSSTDSDANCCADAGADRDECCQAV